MISLAVHCIRPQTLTTPEQILGNPLRNKSFFEPGQHKYATDRCEHGYKSLETQIGIFESLVEIQKDYLKAMAQWQEASERSIHESRDSGTNKKVSLEVVRATKLTTKRIEKVAKRVQENVVDKLVTYKNEQYGKSFLHVKKVKEFKDEFQKNQKSWIKQLAKVSETQSTYEEIHHKYTRAERADRIKQSDLGATEEEKEMSKASVEKRAKDNDSAKRKYQDALEDLNKAKPNYTEKMVRTLEQTHEFERKRLKQFYESFVALQKCLVEVEDDEDDELNAAFIKALAIHNIEDDIKKWNEHYGSEMKIDWPRLTPVKE